MSNFCVINFWGEFYIGSGFSYVFVCDFSALRRKKTKVINKTVSQETIRKDIPISDLLRRAAENLCKFPMSFTLLFISVALARTFEIAYLREDKTH